MNKLEFLRKKHRFTQAQVADVLGLSLYQYRRMESDKEIIPLDKIGVLAKFYDVSPDFLTEDPRLLLIQRIQGCPEDWLTELQKYLDFLEFRNR